MQDRAEFPQVWEAQTLHPERWPLTERGEEFKCTPVESGIKFIRGGVTNALWTLGTECGLLPQVENRRPAGVSEGQTPHRDREEGNAGNSVCPPFLVPVNSSVKALFTHCLCGRYGGHTV